MTLTFVILIIILIITSLIDILLMIKMNNKKCKWDSYIGKLTGEIDRNSAHQEIIRSIYAKWQANCKITNNTSYNVEMTGAGAGNTEIKPGEVYSWKSSDINNTKALRFYEISDSATFGLTTIMQGNLSFGPKSGVYADRGWMDPKSQTIEMIAIANSKKFTQKTNGGRTILAWNEFERGGDITLTFNKIW